MHLHDLMGWEGPMTHRQFTAWMRWLSVDSKRPKLTDYYLMQVACEVRRKFMRNPGSVKIKEMRLKFDQTKEESGLTREEAARRSKLAWGIRLAAAQRAYDEGHVARPKASTAKPTRLPPAQRDVQLGRRKLQEPKDPDS